MEMLISPLSAENRVIRDFWGIKIARSIRVIFYAYFPQSVYRISPFQSKNPNRRLCGRFFGSKFLILATGKNHFPPPFGKWFSSLRL